MNENEKSKAARKTSPPRQFTNTTRAVDRLVLPADTRDVLRLLLCRGGFSYEYGLPISAILRRAKDETTLSLELYEKDGDTEGARMIRVFRRLAATPAGLDVHVLAHLGTLAQEGLLRIGKNPRQNPLTGETWLEPWCWPIRLEEWPEQHFLTGLALRLG